MKLRFEDAEIALPIQVVKRGISDKRPGEAYILQSKKKHSYVVGCSSRGHADYIEITARVSKHIQSKKFTMVSQAKAFVEQFVSGEMKWTT